jgi:hypothetical protein
MNRGEVIVNNNLNINLNSMVPLNSKGALVEVGQGGHTTRWRGQGLDRATWWCGLIHLKCIYNFWCSMLIFTPFALCFITLHGIFMWFPELTYWQDASASSLFSAIFVFQKSYIGNILRIGWNKFQNSYFSQTKDEDRKRARGGPGASLTPWRRGPAPSCAPYVWGVPGSPLTTPLRLYKALGWKTLGESVKFPEQFRSSATTADEFRG